MVSRSPWMVLALAAAVVISIPLAVLLFFAPASQSQCSTATSPVAPGPGGSGLNATAGKAVARVAYDAGWRGDDLVEMVAVSYAESSWNARSGNGTYAGLWAVPEGTPNVYDPLTNAQTAYALWTEHVKPTPSGVAGGPDPTPGSFTGNAPVIDDSQTVDGGLPLNIPEEPWQDWPPSGGFANYQTALAFLNQNIGSWGLPAGWATNTTTGTGGGGTSPAGATTTAASTTAVGGGGCAGSLPVPTTNGPTAKIQSNGLAEAPANAPQAVKQMIAAGNQIIAEPYVWGGGHSVSEMGTPDGPAGYDCSGATSYVLWGAGLGQSVLGGSPQDSTGLESVGQPGAGQWATWYANPAHAWIIVAGIALDTSNSYSPSYGGNTPEPPGSGPRWITAKAAEAYELTQGTDHAAYVARHPAGL